MNAVCRVSLFYLWASVKYRALILFVQTLAFYKSFTYLLTSLCCVCVLSGFNIGSANTTVAATSTQSSPATAAATSTTSTASSVGAGPAAATSKSVASSSRRDVNQDVCNVPGFTVLQWLLSQHPHIPHVYFMMMALLVGQPVQQLPHDIQVL